MKNKKIAIISNVSGSLINFRGELIKEWINMGYKVYAFAPKFKVDDKKKLKSINAIPVRYELNRSGLNPFKDLKSIISLYNNLKKINPAYIYGYTIKPVIYSSLISNFLNLKGMYSMITGLGYAFKGINFKEKIVNKIAIFLYKISLKNNTKVFFQNPDDMNLFIKKDLINKEKTFLVNGSGVDIEKYYKSKPNVDNISFLIMARLLKSKGIKEYIEAAKIIKNNYPNVEFNILGSPGKGPDALNMDYINQAHEEGIINYLGRKPDVRPYIAQSSVYVLPSYREGTPRSVLESMSMGKPIITTNVPGCRETVIDGENGFLIPVKDHITLADKMKYFIENKSKIIEMGKKSRKIVKEKYDVHKVNKNIISAMGLE